MENTLGKIVSLIIFFIIGLIVVWGAFNLARLAAPAFSSFFNRLTGGSDGLDVTLSDVRVHSGVPVTVSWNEPSDDALYALVYPCREELEIKTIGAESELTAIPCGAPHIVADDTDSLRIVPTFSGESPADVPITILALPRSASGEEQQEGGATLTVIPRAEQESTQTAETPRESSPAPQAPAAPRTPADLQITILSVGTIDPYTDAFSSVYPTSQNQTAAVRFRVKNAGGTASGTWYFSADLPTSPMSPYSSPAQSSLPAGYSGEYTLTFGPVASGGGTFIVRADSTGSVSESNESNNTASIFVTMPYYTGTYQYQTPHYDYNQYNTYNYNDPYYYNYDYNQPYYYGGYQQAPYNYNYNYPYNYNSYDPYWGGYYGWGSF